MFFVFSCFLGVADYRDEDDCCVSFWDLLNCFDAVVQRWLKLK